MTKKRRKDLTRQCPFSIFYVPIMLLAHKAFYCRRSFLTKFHPVKFTTEATSVYPEYVHPRNPSCAHHGTFHK